MTPDPRECPAGPDGLILDPNLRPTIAALHLWYKKLCRCTDQLRRILHKYVKKYVRAILYIVYTVAIFCVLGIPFVPPYKSKPGVKIAVPSWVYPVTTISTIVVGLFYYFAIFYPFRKGDARVRGFLMDFIGITCEIVPRSGPPKNSDDLLPDRKISFRVCFDQT